MKNRYALALSLALLMVPGAVQAQGREQRDPMAQVQDAIRAGLAALDEGSVQYLVTKGADLQLTRDQVVRLNAIGRQWSEATQASRQALRTALQRVGQQAPRRDVDRQELQAQLQQILPHAMLVQQEDVKAFEEALRVLQPAQQRRAKALIEARVAELQRIGERS